MAERSDDRLESLVAMLEALSNSHRLRIIAVLNGRESYVSELARELQMSRPLLHMHLQKLEKAGLVTSRSTVADDGKARRYYISTGFDLRVNADVISEVVDSSLGLEEE